MITRPFSTLPQEIQDTVASYLNQQDLTVCIRICRAWNAVFFPALWRHVEILLDNDNTKQIADTLKVNGELVHSLRLTTEGKGLCKLAHLRDLVALPKLTSMEITGSFDMIWDEQLARLVGLCSPAGWKRLSFCFAGEYFSCLYFRNQSFAALLNHVNTLVVVRFEGLSKMNSEHIDTLLCSAPLLKDVYIYSNCCNRDFVPCMDAMAIAQSEWVCSNLEVLVCQIRGVPRSDITRDICGQPAHKRIQYGTLQESLALQHQIYTKLGRLVKLRELTLGLPLDISTSDCGPRDQAYYRQFDCLAMSLDSGLDLLRDLGRLQVVGLQDMEVYVDGDREQEWVREYWPHARIQWTDKSVDLGIGELWEGELDDW
ncbi:hypothetical protein BGZ95_010886 [Linnemannia exigua]|uniref:F-box domain-containing protein n=1 Tax=Linnemannia exigua TaxID=604196 RepID=A0AAD4DAR2_9FUNG|nr:hypothetical protein BGZ95_010886 [Linnemannia exigua]